MTLKRYADNLVRYIGPVRVDTGAALNDANTDSVTLRLYIESFGMVVHAATTRLRTDADDGATTLLIPHFKVPWIEAGDVIEWFTQDNEKRQATVSSYSAGTDRKTAATNFDTITVLPIDTDLLEGTKLTLVRKAANMFVIERSNDTRTFLQ